VAALARRTDRKVIFYGWEDPAEIKAVDISATSRGSRFTLVLTDRTIAVDLGIPGRFMITNALAAAAVGHLAGVSAEQIKDGLEHFEPAAGRMNIVDTPKGIHIIDDTYNANPGSMEAALATLKTLCGNHRSIFVSGDMKELGQQAESLHRDIGAKAARAGVSRMYATGEFASTVADGAAAEGMSPDNILTGGKPEILDDLAEYLRPEDWILVKGSRAMAMEEIVQGLKQWAAND
jgi:UDP-N-acetylmuramoyl-tripeptide--D-alanyl-D-alanine ligase